MYHSKKYFFGSLLIMVSLMCWQVIANATKPTNKIKIGDYYEYNFVIQNLQKYQLDLKGSSGGYPYRPSWPMMVFGNTDSVSATIGIHQSSIANVQYEFTYSHPLNDWCTFNFSTSNQGILTIIGDPISHCKAVPTEAKPGQQILLQVTPTES